MKLLMKAFEDSQHLPNKDNVMKEVTILLDDHLEQLKEAHPEIYDTLCLKIHKAVYGCHFTHDLLEQAYSHMENDDGSPVPRFTVDECYNQAAQMGMKLGSYNKYDLAYSINMLYSDYGTVIDGTLLTCVKMANKFLHDKDGGDGIALRHYMCMH